MPGRSRNCGDATPPCRNRYIQAIGVEPIDDSSTIGCSRHQWRRGGIDIGDGEAIRDPAPVVALSQPRPCIARPSCGTTAVAVHGGDAPRRSARRPMSPQPPRASPAARTALRVHFDRSPGHGHRAEKPLDQALAFQLADRLANRSWLTPISFAQHGGRQRRRPARDRRRAKFIYYVHIILSLSWSPSPGAPFGIAAQ